MSNLAARVARLLRTECAGWRPLAGGNLSAVARIRLADGRTVVAKQAETAQAEARMLRALADAGAPMPDVLAVGADCLVMSDLGSDDGPAGAWSDLGSVVRRVHETEGNDYGWPEDHAFGAVAIDNTAASSWPAFWAERRLLPFCAHVPVDLARRIEALARHLPDCLPARPKPSLLHGDLWAGNVMARGGRVTGLIDPACYHGHAEVDLAMLALFATPTPAFRETYGQAERGEECRRPVYQLWPALVHLTLFGAGYRGMVERCLEGAGRA